ncbi:keratin-like protein KRT222 [Rhinoderma darwinii]|uniref:keratin-like protein KRT222 n=1 Tax=Rhinoderma darwinii TaxID=43563 RepID=UPI003F6689FF
MSMEQGPGQTGSEAAMSEEESILSDDTKCSVMKNDGVSDEAAKYQAKFNIHFTEDIVEAMSTLQAEKVDEIINQWEGSFFKENPRLRKKTISLRFEVYLEGEEDTCTPNNKDDLPNIEVRMIMRRSCSVPTMSP